MNDTFLGNLLALALCLLLLIPLLAFRFEQAIDNGEVVVGMTSSLVVKVWGEPDHISTSEVRKEGSLFLSVTRETWAYDNPARTVIFEDGLVSGIEQVEY